MAFDIEIKSIETGFIIDEIRGIKKIVFELIDFKGRAIAILDGCVYEVSKNKKGKWYFGKKQEYLKFTRRTKFEPAFQELYELEGLIIDFENNEVYTIPLNELRGNGYKVWGSIWGILHSYSIHYGVLYKVFVVNKCYSIMERGELLHFLGRPDYR